MTTETETEREATVLRAVYEQDINKEEQRKEPGNKTRKGGKWEGKARRKRGTKTIEARVRICSDSAAVWVGGRTKTK